MILLLLVIAVGLVSWIYLAVYQQRQYRRAMSRIQAGAAAASEVPCEALSHVRLIPKGNQPAAEQTGQPDLAWRITEALNIFAAENGYPVPVDTLWLTIAVVVTNAIVGEDLTPLLIGTEEGDL